MNEPATIRKVMLVDDDDDVRLVAQIALRDVGGWTTIALASGRAAVALAPSERPDVILLDVMMPDLDGPTALRQLRLDPRSADIPVVFMTAKARPDDGARAGELGIAGVIGKPFDPMTLPDEVRALVGRWHASTAAPRRAAAAQLEAVVAGFAARLPQRVAELEAAIARARAGERDGIADALTLAHRLAGTAGSYGHADVGHHAATIEGALQRAAVDWTAVDGALASLRAPAAAP